MKSKLFIIYLFFSSFLYSQNEMLLLNLKKKCEELKSLECKFRQEKRIKGGKIISTVGSFSFNQKREFVIGYTKPKPVNYTYDGKIFRMFENGIEKKTNDEVQKRVAGMMSLLSDLIKADFDKKKYDVDVKEGDSEITLNLKSRNQNLRNTGPVKVVYNKLDYTLNLLEFGDLKLVFYDKKTSR